MCGIAGIYRFDRRPVVPEDLERMAGCMTHRGPDDEGFYCSAHAGLSMRRLSIIDLAGGHQPIANEDGTIWVVMNGEIYNYLELRQELEAKGHQFRTASDTETVVHLYEEEGTNALQKLNGMFAFALYDEKKDSLWIARDRLGIKPLFYAVTDKQLTFASDLNALVKTFSSAQVDRSAFLRYLALAYVPEPLTIYKDAQKLPPAHWLMANREGVKIQRYWAVTQFQTWRGTEEEACDQLGELLRDAIRLQLRSDVPIGIFLSGGIDSSTVAALAAQEAGSDLHTLTMNFAGKASSSDTFFAQQVANKYRTSHNELTVSSNEVDECLDELTPFIDEPVADSALIPSYILARTARAQGLKVLLTGAGGDEIFGGYRRHFPPRFASPSWIAEKIASPWREGASSLMALVNRDWSVRARDARLAFGIGISGVSLATCFQILRRKSDREELVSCVIDTFRDIGVNGKSSGYAYPRMCKDLREYLVGDILALLDKSTMACSVEGRVPLLDHRLVEFAFALPEAMNLLGARPKGLFRRTLRGILPEALLNRPKEGFNAPVGTWTIDRFGNKIESELLSSSNSLFQDMFNLKELEKIVSTSQRELPVPLTLFSLYLFSRWHRAHLGD